MTKENTVDISFDFSESYLRLTENLEEMVFRMNLNDGTYVFVNDASEKITGYSSEECLNTPFLIRNIIHPDWKHFFEVNYSRLLQGECPPVYEYQIIHKSGETKWLFQKNMLIKDEAGNPLALEGIVKDITEQKNAEQIIRKQNSEYRLIFDSVPAMIWYKDDNNKMLRVNHIAARTKGLKVPDMEGRFMEEFYPDEAEMYLREDREVISTGKPKFNIIEKHQTGSGEKIWVRTDRIPYRNEKGEITGVLVFATDISVQKNIEEQLLKIEQKNSAILNAIPDILFSFDKDGNFIDYKVKNERDLFFLPKGFLTKNISDVFSGEFSELLIENIRRAFSENDTQIFEYEFQYGTQKIDFEIRIVSNGENEVLAILRDITYKKRTESALKESEAKFRDFAESAPVSFTRVLMKDGKYEFANSQFEKTSGYTLEEFNRLTPEQLKNLIHPDDYGELSSGFNSWVNSECPGVFHIAYRTIVKTGKMVWLDTYHYADFDESGKPAAINQIYVDITEQKKYEELLKISEEKFRSLSQNAPITVTRFILENNKYEFVNEEFIKMTGYTMDEINNLPAAEINAMIHPADKERVGKAFRQWVESGYSNTLHIDYRMFTKSKEVIWLDTYTYPEYSGAGKPRTLVQICIDITEKQKADETLKQSESRFRTVAETLRAGILIIRGEKIVYCNPYTLEISGYSMEEINKIKFWEIVHPDNREVIINRIKARFNDEFVTKEYEFQVITKSNELRWVRANAELMDYEGEKAVLSIIIDITEIKRAESALKLSETKFRAVAESMPAEIVIYQGSKFIYANPYAEVLTGYSVDEIVGSNFWEFTHPDFREIVKEKGLSRLEGKVADERYEIKIVTKSGEEKWLDYSASVLELNGLPAVLGAAVDITQRKLAESALSESEERYRAFIQQSTEGIYRIEFKKPVDTRLSIEKQISDMFDTGYIAECNEITAKMYGFKNSFELIGNEVGHFLVSSEKANYEYLRDFIKSGYRTSNKESNEINKDGETVYFANNAIGILENGYLMRIWVTRKDITDLKKSEEMLRHSLSEKEVLLKEIHHRVKNNLQIITSLLKLQSAYITDQKSKDLFKESQNRVQSMALIHQRLYQSKDLGSIKLNEYAKTLSNQIMQSFGIDFSKITVRVDADNIIMTIDNAIPCGLIINELITNSLKHAFPDGKKGSIKLDIRVKENNYLLEYSDDGIGISKDFDINRTNTFGLKLVKTLVDQVKGNICINSDNGTHFSINFPDISNKERLELIN